MVSMKPDADKRETRRRLDSLPASFRPHGLIDAEDDEALAIAGGEDEGEERETSKDCRGVGVYVDSMNWRWERG